MCYSRLSEMARLGTKMDATHSGQIHLVPWQRKLATSPSIASKDCSRLV